MSERTAGYQSWQQLLFAHWRVDPDRMQVCLPHGLEVEVFDGSAWLGLVPFSMERVRPWWSPTVPGVSWFLETNLRTYVRNTHGTSGVWFFSLDANHRLAVQVARTFWHLNYRFAQLQLTTDSDTRKWSGCGKQMKYNIRASLPRDADFRTAAPDSLEYFLLERYRLFAQRRNGHYYTGIVHHDPYTFCDVSELHLKQNLTASIDSSSADRAPDHIAYSPGVDVRVSPLLPVDD